MAACLVLTDLSLVGMIRSEHPDKGGDPEMFKQTHSAFEILRKLFEDKALSSFATTGAVPAFHAHTFAGSSHPMYEYFQEAADEPVPSYRVELAKSGVSKCMAKGGAVRHTSNIIPKASIRVGRIDVLSGTYTKWSHLECWRVPSKIWLGVLHLDPFDPDAYEKALVQMNEVLFCGLEELPKEARMLVVAHVMDRYMQPSNPLAQTWAESTIDPLSRSPLSPVLIAPNPGTTGRA